MSYAVAMERMAALGQELYNQPGRPRRKFELAHMRALMEALGEPQRRFRSILVAGTNGKGSTSATLASILRQAGYRTALYTSPHLSRVNERIQVNGETISDEDFAEHFARVEAAAADLTRRERLPGPPSFFETATAIAFLEFAAREAHTAVLEVGMGGRLDATNIVEPILSVITDISLDHMEWLGATIAEIAGEKAGILRSQGVMVTLPQHPEATRVLDEAARGLGVRNVNAARYLPAPEAGGGDALRNVYRLEILGEEAEIDSPLSGLHQRRNLALAIAAAVELKNNHGYDIGLREIAAGIGRTVWPARLERFEGVAGRPDVLLDAGHNPAGARSLREAVSALDHGQPMTLIFGCLADKPVEELALILCPLFRQVVVTEVGSPRSASLAALVAAARAAGAEVVTADGPEDALEKALKLTPATGLVVAAGSIYLVGKLREKLAPPPFSMETPAV